MACGVAIDIDGHGKAGDMGGHVFDVHLERSNATAQALGTDPQTVDELEQFILHQKDRYKKIYVVHKIHDVNDKADNDKSNYNKSCNNIYSNNNKSNY